MVRLVIHSEIESPADLFTTMETYIQKVANPFELEQVRTYILGVAQALTRNQANEANETTELMEANNG